MTSVVACPLPEAAILQKYSGSPTMKGIRTYTDCYSIETAGLVTLPEFVLAFYTTPVFRLERLVLRFLVGKPSTDEQAKSLSEGTADTFAAWSVEQRAANQLLMCDFQGRTRSWFMVRASGAAGTAATTLFFGSAVVPGKKSSERVSGMGAVFRLLLGFHKLYSRILLRSARSRLRKRI